MVLAQVDGVPGWFAPALVAAVIAALGYVGRLTVDAWRSWRARRADDFARLLRLQAHLAASGAAFRVQRELAQRLADMLRHNHPEHLPDRSGLERLFTALHDQFSPDEAELHLVIRGYTEHALRPVNASMVEWLNSDTTYRTLVNKKGIDAEFAQLLNRLDAHLLLWLAKYEAWIPGRPEHALVYLNDEERQGMGFPGRTRHSDGIEEVLEKVIDRRGTRSPARLDSEDQRE
jgi:hypothetical protein